MTIEVAQLVSVVSLGIAFASFIISSLRNNKKDTTEEVEERASMNARVLTKLDAISDDLRDIKKDNQDLRNEMKGISDRVLILEQRVQLSEKVNYGSSFVDKGDL